jgi:hypothetical protein
MKRNTYYPLVYSPLSFLPRAEEEKLWLRGKQDVMLEKPKSTLEGASESDYDECSRSRRMLIEEQRSWQAAKRSALVEKFARVIDLNGPYIIRPRPDGGNE